MAQIILTTTAIKFRDLYWTGMEFSEYENALMFLPPLNRNDIENNSSIGYHLKKAKKTISLTYSNLDIVEEIDTVQGKILTDLDLANNFPPSKPRQRLVRKPKSLIETILDPSNTHILIGTAVLFAGVLLLLKTISTFL